METITYHPTAAVFDYAGNEIYKSPHFHADVFSQAFSVHNYYNGPIPSHNPRYIPKSQRANGHFGTQVPSPPISTDERAVDVKHQGQEFEKSFTYNNIQLEDLDYSQQSQSFDPDDAYHTADRLIREVEGGLHLQQWPEEYNSRSNERGAKYRNTSEIPQHSGHVQQYQNEYNLSSRGIRCDGGLAPDLSNQAYNMFPLQMQLPTRRQSESELSQSSRTSSSSANSSPPRKSPKPHHKVRKQRSRSEAEKAIQHSAFLARNRKAASNCRMRKKDMEERLSQVCSVERARNTALKKEYDELVKEVGKLREMVESCVAEDG